MADSILLKGVGIHTGKPAEVRIAPSPEQEHQLVRGKTTFPLERGPECIERADYSTVVNQGQGSLRTPEHCLAALAALGKGPWFRLQIKGEELPFMDGSAASWWRAFESCHGGPLTEKADFDQYATSLEWRCQYSSGEIQADKIQAGEIQVTPHEEFAVTYTLRWGSLEQTYTWKASDPESYLTQILPARSFSSWKQIQAARKKGLLRGVNPEAGIAVAESEEDYREALQNLPEAQGVFPFINIREERVSRELAKHKILDLVGDLALFRGSLPRVRIHAVNSGHVQNHQLIRELYHEQLRDQPLSQQHFRERHLRRRQPPASFAEPRF